MQLTYIGTKQVSAEPMTRAAYNTFRGWALPSDENGDDEGYLVEYLDGGKPNTPTHAGYVSWSPKEQFEAAYRSTCLTFGDAIFYLKAGKRVARTGWNGKEMWVALSGPLTGTVIGTSDFWCPHNADHANRQGGYATVLPCITMKTATGEILMGWLASQTDMLAEDWTVLA